MLLFQPESVVWRRNAVLVASLFFILIGTGSIYFIVVALKEMAAEFDWPRTVPSTAYALQYMGAGVGGIFMGWCFDRRGMAIPAFVGASMIGAGAILTSFITNQWQLLFVYGVMLGFFGRSALFGPLTANITQWFEHNKSFAVGVVGSGQGLSGMLWPPIFQYLMASVGWRQAALIYGLFALATMLPLAFILRWIPPVLASNQAETHLQGGIFRTYRALQLALCVASVGCCVAMSLPLAHLVSHVSDLGYDLARGAEVLSVALGFSIISSLFGVGFLGRRYGGLRTLLVFSATQATLLAALGFVDTLLGFYVVAALFGLGYGGILPCYPLIVRELMPRSESGRRTGLIILCAGIGMALGSWLGGYVFDLTGGYQSAFLIGVAFNVANLVVIVGLIFHMQREKGDDYNAKMF